ncbi:hypothetical protein Droror1_Dr00022307 [Drosera rotundifolia]
MAAKAVISVVSIILVVGVVIGVVAVVHHGGSAKSSGNSRDENLSNSMKTVNALCAPVMYKDQCIRSLGSVAQNDSATSQDYIKAGLKLALDEIVKSMNLTDTLVPKVGSSKQPERVKMAIDDCKDLLDYSIQRLNLAFNQVGDPSIYKEETKTWDLRLWLSDIITYQTSCVDGFEEAQEPELQNIMQQGTVNGTQLTMSILDIITCLTKSLSSLGYNLNATNLVDQLQSSAAATKDHSTSGSRRLMSMPVGEDDIPAWMSAGDRHLLSVKKHSSAGVKPNAVVALDGSGQFKSINDALKAYDPKQHTGRYVIYVKAGVYKEEVLVDRTMVNVFMYGDGSRKTIVTGNKSFKSGYQTSKTASFAVEGDGFLCKSMGFQNTAGPEGHQAVALRVNAQRAVFLNCRFDGYQDTLYAQTGSHFFRGCTISGTVDFIFGNGATLIQNCMIIVRMPDPNQFNAVTAQGRLGKNEPTGIVIQNCRIVPDQALVPQRFKIKTFLGRPWKPYARTVIMESTVGDLIQPQGYEPWGGNVNTETSFYGEYGNSGPGASTDMRVKWKYVKVLSKAEAQHYSAGVFLKGMLPDLSSAGVPVQLNLKA